MKETRFLIWLLNFENKQNVHILNSTLWAKQHLEDIILTAGRRTFITREHSTFSQFLPVRPANRRNPLLGLLPLSLFYLMAVYLSVSVWKCSTTWWCDAACTVYCGPDFSFLKRPIWLLATCLWHSPICLRRLFLSSLKSGTCVSGMVMSFVIVTSN